MIGHGTSRVLLWASSAVGAVALNGFEWAGQTIEIPFMWLLVLTFVPTSDLIDVWRAQLDRLKQNPSQKG